MTIAIILAFIFLFANFLAYSHARGMTYLRRGERKAANGVWNEIKIFLLGFKVYRSPIIETPADYDLPFNCHTVKTWDGETLACWHIPNPQSKGMVLQFNWFTGSRSSMLPHARFFYEHGYDVFMVDFRGHGESSGSSTTFGYHESIDVICANEYVNATFKPQRIIMHGISQGACALLRAFHISKIKADAVVLECPFDELINTVRRRVSNYGAPGIFCGDMINLWMGILRHFKAFSFKPFEYAKEVTVPTLLLHGERDPSISTREAKNIADNISGDCHFALCPRLGHDSAINNFPEFWQGEVKSFLEKSLVS